MKILLDENLPHTFRHELAGHEAFTVYFMGWSGTRNGELLARAGAAGFDVFITLDNGVPYQQNIAALPLAVMVLKADSNDMDDLRPLVPKLMDALRSLKPRTVVRIA